MANVILLIDIDDVDVFCMLLRVFESLLDLRLSMCEDGRLIIFADVLSSAFLIIVRLPLGMLNESFASSQTYGEIVESVPYADVVVFKSTTVLAKSSLSGSSNVGLMYRSPLAFLIPRENSGIDLIIKLVVSDWN